MNTCEYYEDKHGYKVNRLVELYDAKGCDVPKGWNGISRLVKVRRWGYRNHKPFHQVSFYVLSKPINSAAAVARAIQDHWSIENKLHWIKDVNMGEDDMTITHTNTAVIIAYLNNTAINILNAKGMKYTKDTKARISNKVHELIKIFRSK